MSTRASSVDHADEASVGDVSPAEREKRRWMLGSTFVNLALALGKLAWGLEAQSHVVLADAVHSASDVFGAFLVYLAVRFAPHRSRRFPDGLFKLEDMAALLGGVGVVFAGWEIIRSVFLTGAEAEARMPLQTLAFMGVVLAVQIIFYRYEDRAAKRLSSPGLAADVVNWLGDIGAGVVVVAGVVGAMFHVPHAQEAAVAVIVLLVFHGAYEVIKGALLSLLDAATAEEETLTAKELLEGHARVNHVHDLRLRRAGGALFLQATLIVDAADFETAHEVVDALEAALRERIPRLEGVTLHYEPSRS